MLALSFPEVLVFHQALLVVGEEKRFSTDAKMLEAYLRQECGITFIGRIDAGHLAPDELREKLADAFGSCGVSPLLVAYSGHGKKDGWHYGIDDGERTLKFSYKVLADSLAERPGPTLVINDCCMAGSLAKVLVRRGVDPAKVGVIAGSSERGWCENQLTKGVIRSWRKGRVYRPRRWKRPKTKMVIQGRWGAELDRLYFPKKP